MPIIRYRSSRRAPIPFDIRFTRRLFPLSPIHCRLLIPHTPSQVQTAHAKSVGSKFVLFKRKRGEAHDCRQKDLARLNWIVPCGVDGKRASIAQQQRKPTSSSSWVTMSVGSISAHIIKASCPGRRQTSTSLRLRGCGSPTTMRKPVVRGTSQFHHRRVAYPHWANDGRAGRGGCWYSGAGRNSGDRAEGARLCHGAVW